jgi:hypothetical protein
MQQPLVQLVPAVAEAGVRPVVPVAPVVPAVLSRVVLEVVLYNSTVIV